MMSCSCYWCLVMSFILGWRWVVATISDGIKSLSKIPQHVAATDKSPQHVAATDVRCISQATRVAGSAAVANDKCVVQATKAAVADKECISQSTRIASNGLMSTKVLEMLEAMPDHDFFI